jgi:hypothetical protein
MLNTTKAVKSRLFIEGDLLHFGTALKFSGGGRPSFRR